MSPERATGWDRFRLGILTCGGLGNSPVAPGTIGTCGGLLIVGLLYPLREQPWFHFGAAVGLLAILGLIVGIPLARWAEGHLARKDPGQIVLDELVGFWISLLRLKPGFPGLLEIAVAFLAFRVFDVVKPPPVGWIDRKVGGGLGVMLDDVAAGIYALMLVSTLREFLQWP